MAFQHCLIQLLLVYSFFATVAYSQPTWFAFWSKQPKNADSIKKVEDMLSADAAKVDGKPAFKPIRAKFLDDGKTSATWYWWVKIEASRTTKQDYQDLLKHDLADMINIKELPTEPGMGGKPDFPSDKDIMKPQPATDAPDLGKRSIKQSQQPRWNGRMKRDGPTEQKNAPRQLAFISLREDQNNDLTHFKDYKYDANAGKGARVYVIDSGLNYDSGEWNSHGGRPTPRILYTGLGNKQQAKDLDSHDGHGTCMADLAVGKLNGVAKETLVTSVQIDLETTQANMRTTWETFVQALSAVVDNAYHKRQAGERKHVVLMAWNTPLRDRAGADNAFVNALYTTLKELDDRGIGLVNAMPNEEKCTEFPCKFGTPDKKAPHRIPNLVTVGNGLINNGDFADDRKEIDALDFFTVFGPGDDRRNSKEGKSGIVCADDKGDKNRGEGEAGTSHASAFTAGLMAYHMGNGLNRDATRKLIVDHAYARKQDPSGDGPKMIWNGVK